MALIASGIVFFAVVGLTPPLTGPMRRFIREHSLSLFFLAIFLAALVGQAIAGHDLHNQEALAHGGEQISIWRYVTGSDFGNAVMENWQSEYLQFMLFMLATVWLLQRGSPESKELDKAGRESKRDQKLEEHADQDSPRLGPGRRACAPTLYSNSLLIAMAIIFLGSWFAQSVTGWTDFNAEQADHGEPTVSWWSYVGIGDLLGEHPPELAVGVPRRRLLRRAGDLPAPARLARVEAGRRSSRRDRRGRLILRA